MRAAARALAHPPRARLLYPIKSLQVPAGLAALAAGAGAEDDDSSEGSFQADAPLPSPTPRRAPRHARPKNAFQVAVCMLTCCSLSGRTMS